MLAESEQMRKEADDTGPMAELEHWKMRMAKFNSLVEQINDCDCRAVLRILHIAKSKTLKVSFELLCCQFVAYILCTPLIVPFISTNLSYLCLSMYYAFYFVWI